MSNLSAEFYTEEGNLVTVYGETLEEISSRMAEHGYDGSKVQVFEDDGDKIVGYANARSWRYVG